MLIHSLALCLFSFGSPSVTVPQGSVARWVGECDACGMDGKTYKPVDGACYFPVDMAREPDTIEIARWVNGNMEKGWLTITAVSYPTDEIDFPDDRFVKLSQEDLERHYAEQAQIKPLFRRIGGPPRFSLPLGHPADPLPEGKYFGAFRIFNSETKNQHTGTDYAIGMGYPVLAVADGEVVLTGDHFFAGNSVYLHHGNGLVTMYFHLSEIGAAQGEEQSRGGDIGKIGSTSRSTGPHLHFGIRWLGARINPAALLANPAILPQVSQ